MKERLQDDRYIALLKNTATFGLGLVGAKIVQFFFLPYLTNVLTRAEYGGIELAMAFVGLAVPVVTLGLSNATLRFGLSGETKKEELLKNAATVLAFSVLVTLLLSSLLSFYGSLSAYWLYIAGIVIAQGVRLNLALFVKADNRMGVYSADSILMMGVMAGGTVLSISIFKTGIEGYFLSEIIANCVSATFLVTAGRVCRYVKPRVPLNKKLLHSMLAYCVPLMFNAISWWVAGLSDRVVLDLFFSHEAVGLYSAAAKLPAMVTTLLSVFTQAWMISAIREYEKEKDGRFFVKVYGVYAALLFCVVALGILVIQPVMKIYVGSEFFEAWRYVPFLFIGAAFLGISDYYGAIYAAAGASLLEIKSTAVCAGSNILLNFLLIPHWGIMGAVAATMVSYVIVVTIRIIDTRKIMRLRLKNGMLAGNLALLMAEALLVIAGNYGFAAACAVALISLNAANVIFTKRKAIKIENTHL